MATNWWGPALAWLAPNPFWGAGSFAPGWAFTFPPPGAWAGPGFGTFPAMANAWAWSSLPQSDDTIQAFVERAIDNDPSIPPGADVEVAVQGGVVTLTGTVPSKRVKHAAGDDAWTLPWVIDVHNQLVIQRPSGTTGRTARATTTTSSRRGS